MIAFTVPGAPQGKGRPRVGTVSGRARVFTPAKTVAYENLIAHAAQQAMAGRPLIDGPVSCAIAIDAPIPASWSKRKRGAEAGKALRDLATRIRVVEVLGRSAT